MATIVIRKKVDVPEKDITDVISAVKSFFDKNPERTTCGVGIFGHQCVTIRSSNIEEDVREAANLAIPYVKA